MKRIKYGDSSFGATYQEQSKILRKWFTKQYTELNNELGRTDNPYFRDALIKNYIYKEPVLEWYMRIKCRIDGYYDLWDKLVPRNATIVDVGCGYGQMSFMLGLLSPDRKILGVDYDDEKIRIAQHSFLSKKTDTRFECADMRTFDIHNADVILFNDSLHYVDIDSQKQILVRAFECLNEGGMVIVRDGDASIKDGHEKIEQTEVWSTRIIKFNKTSESLCFVSSDWMRTLAVENGMDIKVRRCDNDSSETLYILTKKQNEKV